MAMAIDITRGSVIGNDPLCTLFGCSPQGGMRRSLKTNSLVIVSNHVASIYDDRWVDGIFHYTGMGQLGDQSLTYAQNKTLAEISSNGVEVHLFEVDKEGEYRYQGLVELAGKPYQETQPDQSKTDRLVWVFPLRLHDGPPIPYSSKEFEIAQEVREKKAKKLSLDELTQKAKNAPKKAGERTVTSIQRERDPYVSMLAKRNANGKCDLCEGEAPFLDSKGMPYLETHHIVWLAKGGDDTISNTVALCPNCHRKMHILNLDSDREHLNALKIKVK
jgi:5-methylcytosine-specific restriction protein A